MTEGIIETHYGTAADIQATLDKASKDITSLTNEEFKKIAQDAPEYLVEYIIDGANAMTKFTQLLQQAFPNRQCQCALMDLEGLVTNMKSLLTEGPKEPFLDLPLDATQVEDTTVPEGWEGSSASSN